LLIFIKVFFYDPALVDFKFKTKRLVVVFFHRSLKSQSIKVLDNHSTSPKRRLTWFCDLVMVLCFDSFSLARSPLSTFDKKTRQRNEETCERFLKI
jgi:hypothetical protein